MDGWHRGHSPGQKVSHLKGASEKPHGLISSLFFHARKGNIAEVLRYFKSFAGIQTKELQNDRDEMQHTF